MKAKFLRNLVRRLSKWAWEEELKELQTLSDERDAMLEGLEKCGWPCQLVELPCLYQSLVFAYNDLLKLVNDDASK